MADITRNTSINITKLKLTNYKTQTSISLIYIFTDFHIYASIDNACLTGSITIQEKRNNLISLLPIAGYEYLEIEFEIVKKSQQSSNTQKEVPNKFAGTFFITSVTDLVASGESRKFTMNFVSALGIVNPDTRICRAYPSESDKKEYKCEDILKDIKNIIESPDSNNEIFKNIYANGTFNSERKKSEFLQYSTDTFVDTIFNYKIVVPSWKPIALISYIIKYAVSKKNNEILNDNNQFADCVFYENMKQIHEFNSYWNMFNTQLEHKASGSSAKINLVQQVTNVKSDSLEPLYNIEAWDMPNIFDIQNQKMSGLTGNTWYISNFLDYSTEPINITTNNIQGIIQKYFEEFNNEIVYCPYDSLKNTTNGIYNLDICGINAESDENYYRDFIAPHLRANSIVQYLRNATINIKTNPTTDLDIGRYVHLSIAEPLQYNTNFNNNKIQSFLDKTRWVVSALAYHIYSNMTMEVDLSCFTPYLNRYYDGKTFGV